jgi:hypothetical protein
LLGEIENRIKGIGVKNTAKPNARSTKIGAHPKAPTNHTRKGATKPAAPKTATPKDSTIKAVPPVAPAPQAAAKDSTSH